MSKFFSKLDVQNGYRVPSNNITTRDETLGTLVFSILFLSWGLAYGLLDIMNYHIKVAMGVSRIEGAFLAFAYYIAYVFCPMLLGGPLIKRCGYRLAAILGLSGLAMGDVLMSIAAQKLSFVGMCGAHLVVGIGVSLLERTANAYVVNVGPRKRANLRILLAQSMAALGTVIAPILANNTIFDPKESLARPDLDPLRPGRCLMPPPPPPGEAGDLSRVVSFYRFLSIGIGAFAVALAGFLFATPLVREVEVPSSPALRHPKLMFWKHPFFSMDFSRLWYGVSANFLNLGCQVAVAQFLLENMRVNACASAKESTDYMMYAQILFLVGRLAAAFLVELREMSIFRNSSVLRRVFKPRYILFAFVAGAVIFTGLGIVAKGKAAVAFACMVMFMEAPSFPMIFESATAGLGPWTSTAESVFIMSISGGGILPIAMGALTDKLGISQAWSLPTACFGFVFSYTLMCNVVPSFRQAIDKAHEQNKENAVENVEMETA